MTTMHKKLMIAGVILAAAVGYLAFAGSKQGLVYSLAVDQFAQDAQYRSQRVRLNGKVASEALSVNAGQMVAKFQLAGATHRLPVEYHGVIPDMFKADHDVIVEGKLDSAGLFQADVLMTKCASKYEQKPSSHPAVAENTNAQNTENTAH